MISASQLRAARAILDWGQAQLAERAGLTQATVANLETGKHLPSRSTVKALTNVFEGAGVELLPDGARKLRGFREFSGEDSFKRLLEDAYYALRDGDGELLIGGADERRNRSGVESAVHRLRDAGIKMRVLIEEGNEHLLAPIEEYRVVPSAYFSNNPTMIYGDRVAIVIPEAEHDFIQVIVSSTLADSQRRLFNFVWDHCRQPERSIVPQVYSPTRRR